MGSDLAKKEATIPSLLYCIALKKSIYSLVIRQVLEKCYQNVYLTQFSWVDSLRVNKSRRTRRVGHVQMCNQILMGKVLKWRQHLKDLSEWKDNIKIDLGGNRVC